ncbi:MarR family winged helix-turn-helix transcriptional regulator [Nocardiopsis sp. MG754419]|uniref:MarR family winged helix-turn-helix transcriptional regulator n=1 Tax=Nocardiopsis sp. MG754419 TaxID=2259865 RepID=UPI001BAB27E8|nr:MarR family winged helix-turn-helix transcriptional regulator [Nocardiopsis sp. MG754419]MBR8744875.1 MarR family transcriptional regulator [Nocardiopsis sp. MG754419]
MSTESSRPGPPDISPSILVLTLARRVESELNAALAPLDLTVSRLALLGHIAAVPGLSFSELARMSAITVQSAHGAVKTLTAKGLVRDHTARSGSASTIEVTPEGARLLDAAKEATATVDAHLFGPEADKVHQRVGTVLRDAFASTDDD